MNSGTITLTFNFNQMYYKNSITATLPLFPFTPLFPLNPDANVTTTITYKGIDGLAQPKNVPSIDVLGYYQITIYENVPDTIKMIGQTLTQDQKLNLPPQTNWNGCEYLISIDSWNLSNCKSLSFAFAYCKNLNSVPNYLTNTVTDTSLMFYECWLFNSEINLWDMSSVTDMCWMFYRSINFNKYVGDWQTENVTDMSGVFSKCNNFNNGYNSDSPTANNTLNWETSNVKSMYSIFFACPFNQDITNWETSKVKDMSLMFGTNDPVNFPCQFNNGQSQGTSNQTLNWNTDSVTNMAKMFWNNTYFNQNVSQNENSWNVSNVTDVSFMFNGATNFNNGNGSNTCANIISWCLNANVNISNIFNGSGYNLIIYNTCLNKTVCPVCDVVQNTKQSKVYMIAFIIIFILFVVALYYLWKKHK